MLAWLPSQNGLLLETPQRHSVIRFRLSYLVPSCDSSVTLPRTHSGPLHPSAGSSTTPIDGGRACSISLLVRLSCKTNRPDGQCMASRIVRSRAFGLSVCSINDQIFPSGSQKRAKAHRLSTSLNSIVGPSKRSAWSLNGVREAVSVPLKWIC